MSIHSASDFRWFISSVEIRIGAQAAISPKRHHLPVRVSGRPGWRVRARPRVSPFARFGNVLLAIGHPGFGARAGFQWQPGRAQTLAPPARPPGRVVGTGIGHAFALVGDRLDGFRRRHGPASADQRGFEPLLIRGKPSRATLGRSNIANAVRRHPAQRKRRDEQNRRTDRVEEEQRFQCANTEVRSRIGLSEVIPTLSTPFQGERGLILPANA